MAVSAAVYPAVVVKSVSMNLWAEYEPVLPVCSSREALDFMKFPTMPRSKVYYQTFKLN